SVAAGVSPAGVQPGTAATTGPQPKKISTSPGADTTPLYSPDGKYLAWRSQARAGFEADKWRLFVQDRQSGKTWDVTQNLNRSVGSFAWANAAKDEGRIVFSAEDQGKSPLWMVSPQDMSLHVMNIGGTHADDLVYVNGSVFHTQ